MPRPVVPIWRLPRKRSVTLSIGDDALGEDAARQQVQGVLLVADDDRVPGVVAAVELDDVVDAAGEEVGRLAFSLVAPLGSDDDDGRHGGPFRIESG